MGRSGPRRKTGCMTCRRRKVRCDETKPVCSHCTRLRLQCVYKSASEVTRRRIAKRTTIAIAIQETTPHTTTPPTAPEPDAPILDNTPHEQQRGPEDLFTSLGELDSYSPDFSAGFDVHEFIGGITLELEQKQQGLSDEPLNQSTLSNPLAFPSEVFGSGSESYTSSTANVPSLVSDTRRDSSPSPVNTSPCAESINRPIEIWSLEKSEYEDHLVQHFQSIDSLPTIFVPMDIEWKFAKPAILALAREFNPLMNAIYCFSEVHKSRKDERAWRWAPSYYTFTSAEIQSHILDDTDDSTLRKVFAAVFLLMLSEVLFS